MVVIRRVRAYRIKGGRSRCQVMIFWAFYDFPFLGCSLSVANVGFYGDGTYVMSILAGGAFTIFTTVGWRLSDK